MWRRSRSRARGSTRASITVAIFCILAAVVVWQRQTITDTIVAMQYTPDHQTAAIRSSLKLTDYGTLLFNASRTELQSAKKFNQSCGQLSDNVNPILGCYSSRQIYIYAIENKQLDGIEETTAAHELLHAAYERMDESERSVIDAEIQKVIKTIMTPDLKERLEYYRKNEPGQENNELHSILGSEFSKISQPLEDHYRNYFTDRTAVTNYYEQYNSVFSSVRNKLESQLNTINELTKQSNLRVKKYNKSQQKLETDINAFNNRVDSGGYRTQVAYQADRAQLQATRDLLEKERASIQAGIQRIQQLVSARQKLLEEYEVLNQSINSTLDPINELEG